MISDLLLRNRLRVRTLSPAIRRVSRCVRPIPQPSHVRRSRAESPHGSSRSSPSWALLPSCSPRAMRDASGLGWIGFVAPMVILPALIVPTIMGSNAGAQGMAYASTPREFTMSKLGKRLSVTHWILLALAFGAEWIREMVN